MAISLGYWKLRAPLEFLSPHQAVAEILFSLQDLDFEWTKDRFCEAESADTAYRNSRHQREVEKSIKAKRPRYSGNEALAMVLAAREQDMQSRDVPDVPLYEGPEMVALLTEIAGDVIALRDGVLRGEEQLHKVEEEFGAVADGVARYEAHRAVSVHRLVVDIGQSMIREIVESIGLFGDLDDVDDYISMCESFTAQVVLEQLKLNLSLARELHFGIRWSESCDFEVLLEQEVFRAWKRKYPAVDADYESSASSTPQITVEDLLGRPVNRRPAYKRDHYWRTWKIKNKLGPAKIRDKWNGMTNEERQSISPKAWHRAGGLTAAQKKAGRELVKKALRRAEKEAKSE